MMPRLSAISIENMRPRAQRYAVPDSGCRGLYLNVYPTGRKSYSVRYRFAGATRNLTLDGFPPLALARKAATDALAEVDQGRDPAAAKLAAKTTAAQRESDTVERLADAFIEKHAKRHTRPNSIRATEAAFRNIIKPAWGKRTVHEIARRDVIELLDGVAADRPILANRTRATLSRFFGWLCERGIIAASPCVGVKAPSAETARDRVLDDTELRRLWLASDAVGGKAGAYVKLLILTGQRRSEIAHLRWGEVDGDVLALPAERMKGKQAHVVPLSSQAAAIIAAQPKVDDFVLGGWRWAGNSHHVKRALDAHMGKTPKWVVHDIRRSVASGMAKIGVQVPVIEKILAHRSGTFRGIVGTYQRHSFLPEMAAALQKWGDHIERLVGGKPAKVVKLRRHQ
jgi:integrase